MTGIADQIRNAGVAPEPEPIPITRAGSRLTAPLIGPWGRIDLVAENLRRERAYPKASVQLWNGRLLAADDLNLMSLTDRRQLVSHAAEVGGIPKDAALRLREAVQDVCLRLWAAWVAGPEMAVVDVLSFVGEPEVAEDWVIPDLLESQDRLIVVASEGRGKSTLLRQIAVQVAAGIHPFTLERFEPQPTLYVDAENSVRHVRRKLRPLIISAGDCLTSESMHVAPELVNLDLTSRDDAERLLAVTMQTAARLVCIGPLYKIAGGDPMSEEHARSVAGALDVIRHQTGTAVIIEAHAPHEQQGKRVLRPYGASLWLRWPEHGISIDAEDRIGFWRGSRDERRWPRKLTRGGEWPWTVGVDEATSSPALDAALTHAEKGGELTFRVLADMLRDAGFKVGNARVSEILRVVNNRMGNTPSLLPEQ